MSLLLNSLSQTQTQKSVCQSEQCCDTLSCSEVVLRAHLIFYSTLRCLCWSSFVLWRTAFVLENNRVGFAILCYFHTFGECKETSIKSIYSDCCYLWAAGASGAEVLRACEHVRAYLQAVRASIATQRAAPSHCLAVSMESYYMSRRLLHPQRH